MHLLVCLSVTSARLHLVQVQVLCNHGDIAKGRFRESRIVIVLKSFANTMEIPIKKQ